MKTIFNFLLFIATTCILLGALFFVNDGLPQVAFILVGVIFVIMLLALIFVSKLYPRHQIQLGFGICGIILLLFVPSLLTLGNLQEPVEKAQMNHFFFMFILLPVLFIGAVIVAYRQYFIKNSHS